MRMFEVEVTLTPPDNFLGTNGSATMTAEILIIEDGKSKYSCLKDILNGYSIYGCVCVCVCVWYVCVWYVCVQC